MFLGIDLGTSGVRLLLVSEDGQAIASAEAPCVATHPHPGWSEQDPAQWIQALETAMAALPAEALAQLRGMGASGHMHGATVVDAAGAVLRPCILWNDTRSHAEAAALDGQDGVRDVSGNIVFPGFTAPKLAWMAKHEPDVFARVAKVLLPKDYLTFFLTGVYAGDMSDAAGTAWLDVGARAWSQDLLAASGMRADQMPELHEGSAVVGTLKPELASSWGLPPGVQVVAGGGDNAVAACGVGALGEGDGFVSLGTSGVLLAARDRFAPMPDTAVHTFCHAIPGTWYQMGVILAATDSLNWLSRNLGQSPAALSETLGEAVNGPGSTLFLPYLSGERTPHNDSAVRGAFLNLDISDGPEALTQAVMEGVAFALRDSLEALRATGANLTSVLAIGGGSQSPYWVELLATVLNLPLDLPEAGEFGAALGAARLAIVGVTGADPADIMLKPKIAGQVMPRQDLTAAYDAAYARYRAAYPALKALNS